MPRLATVFSSRELLVEMTRFAPSRIKVERNLDMKTDYYESWDLSRPVGSPSYGYLKIAYWYDERLLDSTNRASRVIDVTANVERYNTILRWAEESDIAHTTYTNGGHDNLEPVIRFYVTK